MLLGERVELMVQVVDCPLTEPRSLCDFVGVFWDNSSEKQVRNCAFCVSHPVWKRRVSFILHMNGCVGAWGRVAQNDGWKCTNRSISLAHISQLSLFFPLCFDQRIKMERNKW